MREEALRHPLHLTNTLKRGKERFDPIDPPRVGLYVCGPTVYGEPHLGHARSAITFDILVRYLRHLGYVVRYVRNITDVGHLQDEQAEQGEDKIAHKARLEKVEPMEIAQRYTNSYHDGMDALNCGRPNIEPTATGHIPEQIELTRTLLEKGFAYEVNGSVYFDLEAFTKRFDYGTLSGKDLEQLKSASRETVGHQEKRSPHDFALWKKAEPEHIMRWNSPWGEGFPGWHIECTAMSTKYLGESFDIHGGGLDLQFPHHEAEIAQSCGVHGHGPARLWMHHNLVTFDGAKMSKSAGNFITLNELFTGAHERLEKAVAPMVVRFLLLQAHYLSPIDFSNDALLAAEKGLRRLMQPLELLDGLVEGRRALGDASEGSELDASLLATCQACYSRMSDDLNTPQAIAELFELATYLNALHNAQQPLKAVSVGTLERVAEVYRAMVIDILGFISHFEAGDDEGRLRGVLDLVIELRAKARMNRDFATSDRIRDALAAVGIQLKDSKSGQTEVEFIEPVVKA